MVMAAPARARSSPYAGCTLATWLTITVVVAARNRAAPLSETLRALVDLDYPDLRIIVVDGSDDEVTRQTVRRLAEHHANLSLISIGTASSSAARDLGAALSHSDIVAYADDDCIVSPHWPHAIAVEFADPMVAAVFGRLLPHPDGSSRRDGRAVDLKAALHRQRYSRKTPPWRIGHGGNMAVRRGDLLAIGGFDPLLGAGGTLGSGEGADIAYRLLVAGHAWPTIGNGDRGRSSGVRSALAASARARSSASTCAGATSTAARYWPPGCGATACAAWAMARSSGATRAPSTWGSANWSIPGSACGAHCAIPSTTATAPTGIGPPGSSSCPCRAVPHMKGDKREGKRAMLRVRWLRVRRRPLLRRWT